MVDRQIDRAMRALEFVLAVAFCLAVVLNFVNVIARYVFNNAIHGADELQVQVLIAMAFLGAAIVQCRGQHLRMDVLANAMPHAIRTALRALEALLVIALAAFTVVQSARYTFQMYTLARTSDALGMPVWTSHLLVVIGFGLIALAALWRVLSGRPDVTGDRT